ncbi:MAG: ABC transporter ATP-binding protein/permease [Gammaproteobacteria bacterium]|nr:ABC transporter ATP-binding protein/permease [Gammaproteobacteria bacterium]
MRTELPSDNRRDWETIRSLLPYLLQYKLRLGLALGLLVLAKLSTIGVPIALKLIVDELQKAQPGTVLAGVPLLLLIGYGLLRLGTSLFNELRNAVFARAAQSSIRQIALKVFRHLHALSLRFHLERQTGGLSRDLERGTRGISQLLRYVVFSIVPTIFEVTVVIAILVVQFDPSFALVTLATVVVYVVFTIRVTNWRTKFRVWMNRADSEANTSAIDSLINYETVKYFGNEGWEARRYDDRLLDWQQASIKSETSLAALNVGQGIIIAGGLTTLMVMAGSGVAAGRLTLGDFVMINGFLIQLYLPLNFLGSIFREIRHCLTDMERMFRLMNEEPEIVEKEAAPPLQLSGGHLCLENVNFGYRPDRQILHDVSFEIPAGRTVAVVGASGSGKSTLARLLFRFYDVNSGRITVDDQDIRDVDLASLRRSIGIVPQDTVLFNDTILYNIAYGCPEAGKREIVRAAELAAIHRFVISLPEGYETRVGERGLKLSGGEKQRIAIARAILKNPRILIFDEATSALDSHAEKAIQASLREVAADHTTLAIAHRLSTVIDADEIVVLDRGRVIERGSHGQLLAAAGHYSEMWRLQQEQADAQPVPVSNRSSR